MKLHSFQELVSRIIHLSTRDKKQISITWSGNQAYTDSKSVNIPILPSGTILTQNQFSIWMGYALHEGPGHQTHTDLELYVEACKKRNNPQFSYILNLLEDIRIENADIKLYPGDRKYLDSVHQFVDNKIPPNLARTPDIMGLIYKHLYVFHRNLNTNIIQGNLDRETSNLISEIDFCHSTQDCIHLADKIVDYLNKKKEEQKQEEESKGKNKENKEKNNNETNQQENNQSSQGNETQEINKNDGLEEESNSNQTTSSSSFNDGSDNSLSNLSENNNGSKKINPESNQENPNQSEKSFNFSFSNESTSFWEKITEIKNAFEDLKSQFKNQKIIYETLPDKDLKDKSIFPPENIFNDRIYVPSEQDLNQFNQTRTNCSSQILALKKMFRIYLQAQTRKSQIRGLEEGKLDRQRLYLSATRTKTIFKDDYIKFLPETAIELIIDMSGSMDSEISRTAAIILAEALNSISKIKLSISGFTTNRNYTENYNLNSGRQNGMDILQFKDFSEPYQKCRAKLGTITNSGGTPLGDAYGKALEHIIPRLEPRRIIFLITDGYPSFSHGRNHSDFLLMKKIHQTAKRFKIQTIGLGIGNCEFLKNYFDKHVNISKIEDLPKNLLEALKSFI